VLDPGEPGDQAPLDLVGDALEVGRADVVGEGDGLHRGVADVPQVAAQLGVGAASIATT
jgi:hypothetical protein